MTEVKLARTRGYCFGVKRAIQMVEQALREGPFPIWTLGPIIHNPVVISDFEKKGVRIAQTPEEVSGGTLILRTHGTTLDERSRIPESVVRIIDATCPFVARAQEKAREFASSGKTVLILGDRNHPEVKSIVSYAGQGAICVKNASELENLTPEALGSDVAVVAQTTSRREEVEKVLNSLKKKGISAELANTICTTSYQRQKAALELAEQCDLVLVVGGRTSANTNQLLRIARENGTKAYLVESAKDVLPEWFVGKPRVGVAAGASTPDWVIKEVVGKVEELEKSNHEQEPEELRKKEEGEVRRAKNPETSEEKPNTDLPVEETARQMYDESFKTLQEGQIVKGRVVAVDDNGVLVDVGYKSEGLIPARELQRKGAFAPEKLSPGDEVMVYILSVDSGEGGLRLSKRRADEELAWQRLEKAYREKIIIEAPVVQEVKGGLVVDVGLRGFVPASQVERGYVNDLSKYVSQVLRLKVLELDRSKNRIILSQRVVLEEEHEKLRQQTWATIAEGQIRRGIVKGITDFGVFVDLGGVDGLLHISELSWGRVKHPSEVVQQGQEIEVKVLRVDKEKGKISLGRKQVLPDPWENVETKYPVGSVVEGEVTRTAPFGAFVQLEPGVEGLVHISEISTRHIAKPEDEVNAGDRVMVKVLRVRPEERKISLSIKEADQTPLLEAKEEENERAPEEQAPETSDDQPSPPEEQNKVEEAQNIENPRD